MRWVPLIFVVLLAVTVSGVVSGQQLVVSEAALTNEDVVKLMKLDLGDELVIAKVNQAVAVDFDLSPDGIAKLRSSGVSKEIIAAMLKRTTAPSQQSQPSLLADIRSFSPEVRIRSKDGEIALVGRLGEPRLIYFFFAALNYYNYPGATSKVIIKDTIPAILARFQDDPKDRQGRNVAFLVKLESDKSGDKRSLKIGSMVQAINGSSAGSPDSDWTLPFDAEQESPGVWRITPKAGLNPGEYGLFITQLGMLYDFSVDK